MELKELERKSGYYHGYMILEDGVENYWKLWKLFHNWTWL